MSQENEDSSLSEDVYTYIKNCTECLCLSCIEGWLINILKSSKEISADSMNGIVKKLMKRLEEHQQKMPDVIEINEPLCRSNLHANCYSEEVVKRWTEENIHYSKLDKTMKSSNQTNRVFYGVLKIEGYTIEPVSLACELFLFLFPLNRERN